MDTKHYGRLLAMAVLSFVSMYALMYAMVDTLGNVYANLNQFYMAGLMTAPMVILELVLMRAMYQNNAMNIAVGVVGTIALVLFFLLIRQQAAISDSQFLKSMIPHHAGAILMCERASIRDPEIAALCRSIISGQQSEIDLMKRKLAQLNAR